MLGGVDLGRLIGALDLGRLIVAIAGGTPASRSPLPRDINMKIEIKKFTNRALFKGTHWCLRRKRPCVKAGSSL